MKKMVTSSLVLILIVGAGLSLSACRRAAQTTSPAAESYESQGSATQKAVTASPLTTQTEIQQEVDAALQELDAASTVNQTDLSDQQLSDQELGL